MRYESPSVPVVYFDGYSPAPGYTNYTKVFVSRSLSKPEQDTILKHELAHIYLQHNSRLRDLLVEEGEVDLLRWNRACDLEIAKHIYDDHDEAVLTSPINYLGSVGVILKRHTEQWPDCEFAEQYYRALSEESTLFSHDGDVNQELADLLESLDEAPGGVQKAVGELVEEAKERIADHLAQEKAAVEAEKALHTPPKPSLASAIDRHLGRAKIDMIKTYRVPNRRSLESDFIKRGRTPKEKTAKVTVYVDRSGSFDATKTAASEEALKTILRKYRARIDCDVLYFNNSVLTKDPKYGQGGTNYLAVWSNILRDRAEVSVVITDSDPCEPLPVDPREKPPTVVVVHIGGGSSQFGRAAKATVVDGH